MQVRAREDIGRCGCGRSPTGYCIGWHGLTEEEYQSALAEYKSKTVRSIYEDVESEGGEID